MATVQKRTAKDGTTSYRVMVRMKGHPTQTATFKRKTDAKRWGETTEAEIRAGRYFPTHEAKTRTLRELFERYRAEILAPKPLVRRKDTERHLSWWEEKLGNRVLADVTPSVIAEHRSQLSRERGPGDKLRSPATVNRYLTSLSHAFTIATREWQWLDRNPVRSVSKLKEPRGRTRFLDEDERERLLAACRASTDERLYPIVVLAISTGARRGELMKLRWPDVDLDRGQAVLHETKNGERRAIPITGLARDLLEQRSKLRRIDTDLVFPAKDGAARFPDWAWGKAVEAAKIEDFRYHDLRHSAASYLAMNGATLAEIAEVLGHKTLAMVKRYSHLSEAHTSSVVAKMNRRIFGGE